MMDAKEKEDYKTIKFDCTQCCLDIFNDFDDKEIKKENTSVRDAWEKGRDVYNLLYK